MEGLDRLEDLQDTGPDWSISRLHTIMACGKKYHYKYVEHIEEPVTPPLAFGSAIHKTIEQFHRLNLEDVQREWSENWYQAQTNVDWARTQYRKKTYDDKGPKILDTYIAGHKSDEWLTLEENFRFVPGDDLPILRGTFDKVQRLSTGQLAIIDYKTSKNPPEQLMVDVDPQLTFYYQAYLNLHGEEVALGLHHLPTDTIYWTKRQPDDEPWKIALDMLREGKERVDNEKFDRNVDWGCRYCPFKEQCLGV